MVREMTRTQPPVGTLTMECATCPVRGERCDDCMVTALVHPELLLRGELPLDADERAAVEMFVRAGLVEPREAERARARRTPLPLRRAVG